MVPNVEIMYYKRTDRVIPQRHYTYSGHGLRVLHCPAVVMHIDFWFVGLFVRHALE